MAKLENKTYLYLSSVHSVSYDKLGWYIDDIPQDAQGSEDFEALAKESASSFITQDIARYSSTFKHLAVLCGAGTSMDNGSNPGKTRTELWNFYNDEITSIQEVISSNGGTMKDNIDKIVKSKNIEDFLSYALLYEKLNGPILSEDGKHELTKELESKIADACKLELAVDNKCHREFIKKVTARKPGEPRTQIYTLNYDTLFEQAAQDLNYIVLDGFSFTMPRRFNGSNFDYDIVYREHSRVKSEESYVPNLLQLFKMHGSINWEMEGDGKIIQKNNTDNPCIIYPASQKYEISYEQPFFEMMAHFQRTLRSEGTLLIVAGFGFQDKHVQNAIKEAVDQNLNFHLIIVCYGTKDSIDPTGRKKKVASGITPQLCDGYIDDDFKVASNVTIFFGTFKEFVEVYPENKAYDDNI